MSVLLQYCFCFMLWLFGHEACGILAPWCGITPIPLALEGEYLATGPRGKSPVCCLEMSKQITIMVPSDCLLFLHLFIHEDLKNSLASPFISA